MCIKHSRIVQESLENVQTKYYQWPALLLSDRGLVILWIINTLKIKSIYNLSTIF